MENLQIIDVTPTNINEHGMFCIKDPKSAGFKQKSEWYSKTYEQGLRMKIAQNDTGEKIGFIEYVPAEFAWRPVDAPGYMFIHCMFIYPNKNKKLGYGSLLVKECEKDAKAIGKVGVAVMTSKGAWITNKSLFLKNGFEEVDKNGRFELCVKKFDKSAPTPKLIKWQDQQTDSGWSLQYSDQCSWHAKAVEVLKDTAKKQNINLKVSKIATAKEAQNAPTGFGVFNLIKDNKRIEDHYISKRRFENILEKEQ